MENTNNFLSNDSQIDSIFETKENNINIKKDNYKILFFISIFLLVITSSFLVVNKKKTPILEKENNPIQTGDVQKNTSKELLFKDIITDSNSYIDINYEGNDFCEKNDEGQNLNGEPDSAVCTVLEDGSSDQLLSKIRYGAIKKLTINNFIFYLTPNYFNQKLEDINKTDRNKFVSGSGDIFMGAVYSDSKNIIWSGNICSDGYAPESDDVQGINSMKQCTNFLEKITKAISDEKK